MYSSDDEYIPRRPRSASIRSDDAPATFRVSEDLDADDERVVTEALPIPAPRASSNAN
jgi:hypothetical protein